MLLNLTADLDTVKPGSVALPPGGEKKGESQCMWRRFSSGKTVFQDLISLLLYVVQLCPVSPW